MAPAKERTRVPEDAFLWELPSGAAENTGGGAVKRGNMKKEAGDAGSEDPPPLAFHLGAKAVTTEKDLRGGRAARVHADDLKTQMCT